MMEPCSWWAYNLSLRWNYQTKHTRGGNKGYGLPYKLSTVPPFLTKFDTTKNNERTKLSADYPKDTSFLFSSFSRSCPFSLSASRTNKKPTKLFSFSIFVHREKGQPLFSSITREDPTSWMVIASFFYSLGVTSLCLEGKVFPSPFGPVWSCKILKKVGRDVPQQQASW